MYFCNVTITHCKGFLHSIYTPIPPPKKKIKIVPTALKHQHPQRS